MCGPAVSPLCPSWRRSELAASTWQGQCRVGWGHGLYQVESAAIGAQVRGHLVTGQSRASGHPALCGYGQWRAGAAASCAAPAWRCWGGRDRWLVQGLVLGPTAAGSASSSARATQGQSPLLASCSFFDASSFTLETTAEGEAGRGREAQHPELCHLGLSESTLRGDSARGG